jgi:hypothetical protein
MVTVRTPFSSRDAIPSVMASSGRRKVHEAFDAKVRARPELEAALVRVLEGIGNEEYVSLVAKVQDNATGLSTLLSSNTVSARLLEPGYVTAFLKHAATFNDVGLSTLLSKDAVLVRLLEPGYGAALLQLAASEPAGFSTSRASGPAPLSASSSTTSSRTSSGSTPRAASPPPSPPSVSTNGGRGGWQGDGERRLRVLVVEDG